MASLTERPKEHVAPFDGVRAIASITIVLFHSFVIATLFFDRATNFKWRLEPFARAYCIGVGALDVFWVVGGYFLTVGALKTIEEGASLLPMLIKFAINRFARFWPMLLLLIGVSFALGEGDYFNVPAFLLFYIDHVVPPPHMGAAIPFTLGPAWSLSVDFQMQLILPLVLFVAKKLNIISARFFVVLSLLGVALRMSVWSEINSFVIMTTNQFFLPDAVWAQEKVDMLVRRYGYTPHFTLRDYPGSNNTGFYQSALYYPTEMRASPFFLGAALALMVSAYGAATKSSAGRPRSALSSVLYSALSHFLFLLALLAFLLPTVPPAPETPPVVAQVLLTGLLHYLPALAAFYVLFAALTPPSHPLALGWLRRFLSMRLWFPLSQLSFCLYLVHWRVLLHVYLYMNPSPADVTHAVMLKAFAVTLVLSYVAAVPLHLFVEVPAWNFVRRLTAPAAKAKRS